MRGKSHRCLGKYLVQHYMSDTPERYVKAFLLGCIEPDRNPATYLKGSIRCQWLRGHNYRNARRFMRAISARLEKKEKLGLFDYYTLGKLIHYTTDAFTYAHNDTFPTAHVQLVAATPGITMPNLPLRSINSLVHVDLSTTIATRGGSNSTGIDQAAAIMLRRWDCSSKLVIMTVGP